MPLSLYTAIGPVHKKPPLCKGWHKVPWHNYLSTRFWWRSNCSFTSAWITGIHDILDRTVSKWNGSTACILAQAHQQSSHALSQSSASMMGAIVKPKNGFMFDVQKQSLLVSDGAHLHRSLTWILTLRKRGTMRKGRMLFWFNFVMHW